MNQPPLNPDAFDAAWEALYEAFSGRIGDLNGNDCERMAENAIQAYLAVAQPEVTSDVYTVAIKNTEKSTGRVFFDYPGCTPEIGTLDDARELLSWVNEGTPSSPDSPYSSEARIYKLTEVNDA